MNTTLKLKAIIKVLENINEASLHGLCDDLIYAGALITNLKHKSIQPIGWNPAKHHTIPSPADSIIELDGGLCVFEYSREEDWVRKLKRDVEIIKQWVESESCNLVRFIFVTTRNLGTKTISDSDGNKLSPEKFIEKEFSHFNVQASVFGQKDLLVPLQNSDYFYIRRRWLDIPEDYFQSLKSFETNHIKQAQDRHIYLKNFVETPSRKQCINVLEQFFVQTDVRVLLIHSQGGIGKTRFVLEALKRVKEWAGNIDVLFNQRRRHTNVDEVIPEISEDQESLIVIDDAHILDNLVDFKKILLKKNRAKLVLITRSTAKESVEQEIGYPVKEIELNSLDRESSIELLRNNLDTSLLDQHLKHAARICEGNPLLVGITAHLINAGVVQSLGDLKTDDLVKSYFKEILNDLRGRVALNCYQLYLALLFLLKPFSANDAETRSLIRKLVDINEWQEGFLLTDLEECAVLERHGDTLWLYPDLLGEYLVETTFFSDTPILNFDRIFPYIPTSNVGSVFKTLRELDNKKAVLFLEKWTYGLADNIKTQSISKLSNNLNLLEIIVSRVTDETLQIIDFLLRPENEKLPETDEELWLPKTRQYSDVLQQCLRILEHPHLRDSSLDEVIDMLLKIYFYECKNDKYVVLRKKALEAITKTAVYDLNLLYHVCDYSMQQRIFERVQEWKQDNIANYFNLILGVCRRLLETEMRSEDVDSEGISWSVRPLVVNENLIRLRKDVIFLLQSIFDKVQGRHRIEVIRVLNCATDYPSLGQYGEDMIGMLRDNGKTLTDFYLTLAKRDSSVEVEIFQEIEQQARHQMEWQMDDSTIVKPLLALLQSNERYQLYRTLAGDASLLWREEKKSYDQVQTETDEKIKEIADSLSGENLIEWLEKLSEIAETFSGKSAQDSSRLCQCLFEIGKSKPYIAQALIGQSLTEDNALRKFTAEFIRGIRKSTCPEIAGNYVREWLSGENEMLLLQIPNTYWRVDEELLDEGDVEIFESLLNYKMEDEKQRQELDRSIMFNIRWIYKTNPKKMTGIICQLFKRGDEDSISHHLSELRRSRKQIDLSQWDLSVFENLLQTFVDIPVLDDNAVYILAQYGRKAPFELVPFFERRVEKQKRTSGRISRYNPIPHFLKEIADIYQDHPQNVDVFNQILVWFQKHDYHYDTAAADFIASISLQLAVPLKQTLMELIKSGDKENILAVLKVLDELPEDSVSDELCKEAVKHSERQKQLQDEIENLIVNRVRTYLGLSGAVTTFQNLKERIIPWLEDENYYVRAFAKRIIPKIESRIEYERERAAEDEIKRKKGIL